MILHMVGEGGKYPSEMPLFDMWLTAPADVCF